MRRQRENDVRNSVSFAYNIAVNMAAIFLLLILFLHRQIQVKI